MTSCRNIIFLTIFPVLIFAENLSAQSPTPSPSPQTSVAVSGKSSTATTSQTAEISRERREQAYAKLLEGQRYIWRLSRIRSTSGAAAGLRLAKMSFQKAIELNPNLAEAYTALAEIALASDPPDMEEALLMAGIATKIDSNNFGAHRILARVFTIKSRIRSTPIDPLSTQKAIAEWKDVARLDPRNAEAWAFLSEFYDKTGKNQERIETLRNWVAASMPLDARFYRRMMDDREDLSPETASVKLASALINANQTSEAVEVLSRTIADDPENTEAVDMLKKAVDSGLGSSTQATLEALQQAVFVNPNNLALLKLFAQIQIKMGRFADAVKSLRASVARLSETDKNTAADLQVFLGDQFAEANRTEEAVGAYEEALKIQAIDSTELITDDAREFATMVFGKLIQAYKNAGRINEAKAAIERARVLLGKQDLFSDRQLISLMRETGRNQEALTAVRSLRAKMKEDYGLLRLEAQILTETGKVDEAVALVKPLIGAGKTSSAPSLMFDDFSNYVFISSLYNQAKRGSDAIQYAQKAYAVAGSEEKKQIAQLTLATAQHTSGDYESSEAILRNLLKQTPSNPIALNNLGYFLLEQNRKMDEALTLIKKAVEIDPTNPSYLDSLGWAYFKLGKLGEAELYLKEAINNDASSPTIYEHLGDVYQKQGKSELARQAWQKAVNLTTDASISQRIKGKLGKSPN